MTLNGKELDKDDYSLSMIGTLTVSSQKGQNKLVLSYQEPGWLFVALVIPIIVLGVIGLQWLYTKISIKKVAMFLFLSIFFLETRVVLKRMSTFAVYYYTNTHKQ